MGEVRFNLKDPDAETRTLIYAIFRFSGKKIVLSTGESVNPKLWNPEKQRVRFNRSHPEIMEINNTLERYDRVITSVHRRLVAAGQVTIPLLKTAILVDLNKEKTEAGVTFMEFFEQFKEELRKIRPYNTIKKFNTLYNYMLLMQKEQAFSWDEIDIEWYRRFEAYMVTEKGFSKNFFATMVGTLKRVLNEATDRGVNHCLKYQSKTFKRSYEEIQNIYLSIPELIKLYNHDFSANPRLDRVRDRFLIGCFTGMRYGDYSRLKEVNFIDGYVIQDMNKEDGRVIIPQHWIVKEILQKYNYKLPMPTSHQKFNLYLKEVGEAAGFTDRVQITRTEAGVKTTHVFQKWQLFSSHVARRSLATNLYLENVPIKSIMALTGHKSVKQFLNYVKVTNKQIASSLVDLPFFQNPEPEDAKLP
jgi:site-specific recombinase XerD